MRPDRYIPVHFDEIVEVLCQKLFSGQDKTFHTAAWLYENLVEFDHAEEEESLKQKYFFFSPDDDTLTLRKPDAQERLLLKAAFLDELEGLLDKANFSHIDRDDFEKALRSGTSEGLKIVVNLDDYAEFRIYYRGLARRKRKVRTWKTFFRIKEVEREIYLRAVTVTKLHTEEHIYLKLFKEIPVRDIESLLPRSKVKMRLFDKMKIGGTTGAAVVTGVRTALKGAVLLGKSFIIPLAIGVVTIYLGKTVLNFFQVRDRYRTRIIKDLFYQNLDNNLGVINRLIDSAEEEEATEAVLAYAFALTASAPPTAKWIKDSVEEFLEETWNAQVDFEVNDALAKLTARGLATLEGDRVRPMPLADALAHLDEQWDGIYSVRGGGCGEKVNGQRLKDD